MSLSGSATLSSLQLLRYLLWSDCEFVVLYFSNFYDSTHPSDGVGGITFPGCPSICVYMHLLNACMTCASVGAKVEALSDQLTIDL